MIMEMTFLIGLPNQHFEADKALVGQSPGSCMSSVLFNNGTKYVNEHGMQKVGELHGAFTIKSLCVQLINFGTWLTVIACFARSSPDSPVTRLLF